MPQLRLPHAMIADVFEDTEKNRRTVVLNVNEEYLFEMLDSINPKNIIKYLDMRGIQHRAPSEINIYQCKSQRAAERNKRKIHRIVTEQARLKSMISEIVKH